MLLAQTKVTEACFQVVPVEPQCLSCQIRARLPDLPEFGLRAPSD